MTTLTYFNVQYTPRVSLILLTTEKIECENFNFVLVSFFFLFLLDKLKNYAAYTSVLYAKPLLYYHRSYFSWLELHASKDRQIMIPNTLHGLFPICHFVRKYTHNTKTKVHIRTFYLSNDCSTVGDIYSLG